MQKTKIHVHTCIPLHEGKMGVRSFDAKHEARCAGEVEGVCRDHSLVPNHGHSSSHGFAVRREVEETGRVEGIHFVGQDGGKSNLGKQEDETEKYSERR